MMAIHVTGQAIRGDQSRINRFFALGNFNNAILPNRAKQASIYEVSKYIASAYLYIDTIIFVLFAEQIISNHCQPYQNHP